MDFGMPVLIETQPIEACAALCGELGLDFIELNMNFPDYQADKLDIGRLNEIARQYSIYYTIHLDEKLNPCDFNKLAAAAYTDTAIAAIEAAQRLYAPVLNMHLAEGVFITLPNRKVFLFDEYTEIYKRKLTDFRDKCKTAIGGAGILLCVENTNGYDRADFLLNSLDLLLKCPAFALTFDIGHNAGINFKDEPIILERADRLRHMHLHDAKGKSCHLPLGDGELDIMRYLRLAEECGGRCVLETKTVAALRQSVNWLKERSLL